MRGRGVFLMAAAGVVLLIGMAAGLFLKGGGARAGREYIAAEAIAGAEENKEENGDVGQNPMEEQGDLPGQEQPGRSEWFGRYGRGCRHRKAGGGRILRDCDAVCRGRVFV